MASMSQYKERYKHRLPPSKHRHPLPPHSLMCHISKGTQLNNKPRKPHNYTLDPKVHYCHIIAITQSVPVFVLKDHHVPRSDDQVHLCYIQHWTQPDILIKVDRRRRVQGYGRISPGIYTCHTPPDAVDGSLAEIPDVKVQSLQIMGLGVSDCALEYSSRYEGDGFTGGIIVDHVARHG